MARKKAEKTVPQKDDAIEKRMFQRIHNFILKDNNYLTPKMSRDLILKKTNVPKNKFAPLFRKYLGIKYTDYVNGLRLDHEVKQLEKHPEYTVESIEQECGIVQIKRFYRLLKVK